MVACLLCIGHLIGESILHWPSFFFLRFSLQTENTVIIYNTNNNIIIIIYNTVQLLESMLARHSPFSWVPSLKILIKVGMI